MEISVLIRRGKAMFILPKNFIGTSNEIRDSEDIILYEYKIIENIENCKVVLENCLIVFVLKGRKILKTRDKEYQIEAGNIIFMGKGSYIASQIIENEEKYEVIILSVKDKVFEKLNGSYLTTAPSFQEEIVEVTKMNMFLESCLISLLPYFSGNHKYIDQMLRSKVEEIIINLINADESGRISSYIHGQIIRQKIEFREYILNTYMEPYTVDQFAKKANMSITAFKNEFKRIFKSPPKEWIRKKRLEKAHQMLSLSKYTITEISFLCGFENLSYFIRSFKKEFGETPKKIQMSHKKWEAKTQLNIKKA